MNEIALTVDTPEASAALGRCCFLLRTWAQEARENETADRGDFGELTQPAADPEATTPDQDHYTPADGGAQYV